ncbi:CCR4-NOT transcription complex subunit 1, partial [Mucuna pruriens]
MIQEPMEWRAKVDEKRQQEDIIEDEELERIEPVTQVQQRDSRKDRPVVITSGVTLHCYQTSAVSCFSAVAVGLLGEVSIKANNAELNLFLQLETGQGIFFVLVVNGLLTGQQEHKRPLVESVLNHHRQNFAISLSPWEKHRESLSAWFRRPLFLVDRIRNLPTQIPNIGTHVIINQKLNGFCLQMNFQRVVPFAMDRAIKEIVSSIVQRSVSIVTQTTKELVLKDYAMESDETCILNATHLMVPSLAGSLALVTCKLVTNDNLDLGCAVIEQAATNKAINTIDTEIGQQLSFRRKHREGVGSTFFDVNLYPQGSMGGIPEPHRLKPGQLSISQQHVYEDFVRLPWQNQSSQSSHSMFAGVVVQSGTTGLIATNGSALGQINPGYPTSTGYERESGTSSQPLVTSSVVECLGSSFLEPSLSTRDVVDKFQIVAQKVVNDPYRKFIKPQRRYSSIFEFCL